MDGYMHNHLFVVNIKLRWQLSEAITISHTETNEALSKTSFTQLTKKTTKYFNFKWTPLLYKTFTSTQFWIVRNRHNFGRRVDRGSD